MCEQGPKEEEPVTNCGRAELKGSDQGLLGLESIGEVALSPHFHHL